MRKLKLQVQISTDGFMAGPAHEMDWLQFPWSEDIIQYVRDLTEPVDTILLGRKLAEGFIPHWENVVQNPQDPEFEGGIKFTETPKVVFTKTLGSCPWRNTVLAKGDLQREVNALKAQDGGDLIVYGGGTFVSALIEHNLIDDYHLFVNPSAIGKGMPLFGALNGYLNLNLSACKQFDCGIALMHYNSKS